MILAGGANGDVNATSPELHMCIGRLIAATQEPESAALLNTSLCKLLGSGDKVATRGLYENTFQCFVKLILIICCNLVPNREDFKNELARRFILVKRLISFVEVPKGDQQKKIDYGMENRFKSSKYGAVFLRMGLVNVHRLQKQIQEEKR